VFAPVRAVAGSWRSLITRGLLKSPIWLAFGNQAGGGVISGPILQGAPLSALVHPLRISLALSVVCLVLHDLLSPVRDVGARHLTRDATILLGYLFVVVVVNQLGAQRRRLAELAERQRDELANEIQLAAEVQQSILPRSIPTVPGFEFAARMYPAKTVSGDYLDSSSFPRGRSPW